jgi:DNA-binding MarR family transcriptional regulator
VHEDRAVAADVREGVVRLSRRLRALRQTHGVSDSGIALLSRLHRFGPATPKALASAESSAPQTLTRMLATLEEQALVRRRPDPSDGRGAILEITQKGLAVLREHAAVHVSWLSEAIEAELSESEREIVRVAADLLDRLADHHRE